MFIALKPYQQPGCGVRDFEPFCGTNAFYDATSAEGKQIFNANCAACHKLDRNMTGPALRAIGQKYDTLTIMKFLQGDKTVIESKGYEYTCNRFPQLTEVDISNIIKYTR